MMAKKEKDLVKSAEDFEYKLRKARKRLIKAIDRNGEMTQDEIEYFIYSEDVIFDKRQWKISAGEKTLKLISKARREENEKYRNYGDGKVEVIRGEEYTLVRVTQLGDGGYYVLHFILENGKEL